MISQNYFFSLILNTKCNSCGSSKFEWANKKVVDINIDKYKKLKNGPISLNDCLKYYISGRNTDCKNCGQMNTAIQSRLFFKTGRVLIINLSKDSNFTGNTDPNFIVDINIEDL